MPSSHLILCCPLLLLPPIPPSIGVFSNESALCIRWPKYWSLPGEHPGLICFRMDWLDLLAVQRTRKSLLQAPQFKSINSLALSFLYGPALISIHGYWKSHRFDYTSFDFARCQGRKKNLLEEAWGQGLRGRGEAVAAGTSRIRQLVVHLPSPCVYVVWRKLALGLLSGSPAQPFWVSFYSRP